jgi:ABC-type sugar transport system permease subunit
VVVVVYVGCMLWTVRLSFTSSTLLPRSDWIGLTQYWRLFANDRFVTSAENIVIFGALFIAGCLVLGFLLAVFIDQNVRGEGLFRTLFLYPYAMSFVVTGVAWQWFLDPALGLPKLVRDLGFESFTFLRLAREPGESNLHHRDRRDLAWSGPHHGDPARRLARDRCGSLESCAHRRRPGLALLPVRRASAAAADGRDRHRAPRNRRR